MISITVKNSLDEGTSMHWHGEDMLFDSSGQLLNMNRTTAKSNSMVRWSADHYAMSDRSR